MQLVFLYGPPGVGKLTVARDLAGLTNFKVFHNHLTISLALSVFPFGSAPIRVWCKRCDVRCSRRLPRRMSI